MGKIKRTRLERNVFRKVNKRRTASNLRQSIEASLMLASGITLLFILNTLSSKYDAYKIAIDASTNILSAIIRLFDSLVSLGSLFLIVALAILALTLLLGGLWRTLRIISNYFLKRSKH